MFIVQWRSIDLASLVEMQTALLCFTDVITTKPGIWPWKYIDPMRLYLLCYVLSICVKTDIHFTTVKGLHELSKSEPASLYSNWSTLCNGPYNGFWRYTRWHIHHTISPLSYDVWPSKVNYELSFCHILEAIIKYLLCIYVGSKCRQEFLIGKWLWNS